MAAELVGGAVLSSFLQVAFDRLASDATLHYFRKREVNETLVKKLKIMLISINSVIDDAEYKQFIDPNVRAWLLELKDAVYDAEDVLDETNYLYKCKLEAEAEPQTSVTSKVRKFFNASATSFDQEIESRMKQVLENLEFLEGRKISLGLKEGNGGAVGFDKKWRTETTSLVDEVGIIGRNTDKEIIFQQLKNDRHFSVISIVGMGGLGKTTLAQVVYNDKRVESKFDHRFWVCVSDDFDVLRLTKIIFKKIMASNDDTGDLDALQSKLKDWSSKNIFLIVLDDVWCDDYLSWEDFLKPFKGGVAGSKILITSRNENVALAAPSDKIYHPDQLSDENDLRFTSLKKIPPNMGEMKNLQVRSASFEVGKCNELNIKQLGELNLQGELSIYELQNVVHGTDALQANLKEKWYLEELSFKWNKDTNDNSEIERDVLEKLQPHRNLKKLSVKYYGGTRFPDWFVDDTLSNMVELRLESCKYCLALPSLGLLPSLKSLFIENLDGIVAVGAEFLGSDCPIVPFRSLETLVFTGMVNWEEWDCATASRAFPCLKELRIIDCPKLKENLPEQLLSLDDLVIKDCPHLVALVPRAPTIRRLTLKKCGNVRLEYIPSTLKQLRFCGPCTKVSLLEKIEQTISNSCIEEVAICDCPDWELPLKQHHDSLREIRIDRSCGSLGTFVLDQFPALQDLSLHGCNNLEMISISEGRNHGNLTTLSIRKCPKFVSFPKEGLSTNGIVARGSATKTNVSSYRKMPETVCMSNAMGFAQL
ncbi:putative disease resistance RPP13-like protein 1 [Neltuma alba]|uniref:putative disease resistance RPP13-like protein 1 n=1 Tax=Neltuma alba TaxID=207710 RepID=UPI0010A54A14|nr:putative disease resistance RPP13-like protein 1 [Prosopis alba]